MRLRDEVEAVLHAWDKYEATRNSPPVIDYDCRPSVPDVPAADNRLGVHRELSRLHQQATEHGERRLAERTAAHLTYLRALMGMHQPLEDYVRSTQGCGTSGWPGDYVEQRGQLARSHIEALGVAWGPNTTAELNEMEGRLDVDSAPDAIRQAALDLEPLVRRMTGTDAPYELTVTPVDVDAYWAYWLDGAGQRVRLRLNLRNARFTKVQARQFALHEVLGHGLQSASYAARCAAEDVPWVRLLSVHAPQQVLLEGLAQALPLFVTPDDEPLVTRVRLSHYTQLVHAELHLALNAGASIDACVRHARARVPFWSDASISNALSDRGADPLLRSYLWAYPAGIDWFVRLAETDLTAASRVLRAAYRKPLTPADLAAMWPTGPSIGGPGGAVQLEKTFGR